MPILRGGGRVRNMNIMITSAPIQVTKKRFRLSSRNCLSRLGKLLP